jgi:transcriptional regulator with XRE-family HTH domain
MDMPTKELVTRLREAFGLSVRQIADYAEVSEAAVRAWINGGGISGTARELLRTKLHFDSWRQLEKFLMPVDGEVFVLHRFTSDISRVWEHYLERNASPIFESKIALSYEKRAVALGFSPKANTLARQKILSGEITVRRVEQPRTVERLAELAANAFYFQKNTHYALKLVPPVKEKDLFVYPNILRLGKKVLVLGRTHKSGTPGADPVIMIRGDASEELGDHLESGLWNDENAKVFSSLSESQRIAHCHRWARVLGGSAGAGDFDAAYRDLAASTHAMEQVRI